jgi:uncharacterized integral membrane protein
VYVQEGPKGASGMFVTPSVRMIFDNLLTEIGLTLSDSSTVHIYKQTIHRATQLTTLVARLSGIRTQSGQTNFNDELTA